jgi:L-lactate dehydrogenase complex protein LldG
MDEAAFIARFRRERTGTRAPHPGTYAPPAAAKPTADLATFSAMVAAVGGSVHAQVPRAGVREAVSAVIEFARHRRSVATAGAAALIGPLPGLETVATAITLAGETSPRQWQDVDLAVIRVDCAVAENAAMLVTAEELPGRALAFLAQHVVALVDVATIVPDLHDGYARLGAKPLPHHALWISGPSKTADIEQTLVVGAHGCRSLIVLPFFSGG